MKRMKYHTSTKQFKMYSRAEKSVPGSLQNFSPNPITCNLNKRVNRLTYNFTSQFYDQQPKQEQQHNHNTKPY